MNVIMQVNTKPFLVAQYLRAGNFRIIEESGKLHKNSPVAVGALKLHLHSARKVISSIQQVSDSTYDLGVMTILVLTCSTLSIATRTVNNHQN